jgi:hypothetical protein
MSGILHFLTIPVRVPSVVQEALNQVLAQHRRNNNAGFRLACSSNRSGWMPARVGTTRHRFQGRRQWLSPELQGVRGMGRGAAASRQFSGFADFWMT